VHFQKTPISNVGSSLLWCLLIGLTAFLMISTVRYQNFKELGIFARRPRIALVTAAMLIVLIFRYSEEMLLLLAVAYVSSGPLSRLAQAVRKLIHGTGHSERASIEPHRHEP
jgi:CDP-diacylglycerol--serine O-phosphatidyltransferase